MSEPTTSAVRSPQTPVASPGARWIAIVFGLALLAVAFVTGRELYIRHFDDSQRSWILPITNYVGHLSYHMWMLYAGAVAIAVAVVLLVWVFKPRPTTHVALNGGPAVVWMRPVDVARMTTAAAERVAGVDHAETIVKKNAVELTIDGATQDSTLVDRVARTVGPLVGRVAGSPSFSIKLAGDKEQS